MNTPEKFWARLRKTDTCWIWTGSTVGGNWPYGHVGYQGTRWFTHRLAWVLTNGSIPNGLWVLHRCHTPSCCRPDPLYLGTAHDNTRDSKERGTFIMYQHVPRGEQHVNAKLTWALVRMMRTWHAQGMSHKTIATLLGLSSGHVSQIINNKKWREQS